MSKQIRARVLKNMPANVRALLDKLEAVGGEIVFSKQPDGPRYPFRGSYRMDAADASATVYLRNVHQISYQTVLHELWHVRRHWVEKVTQVMMMPGHPLGFDGMVDEIHNHLEHLFIVPQEAAYGFPPDRWEQHMQAGFAWFRSAAQKVDVDRNVSVQVQIIIDYLFCKYVTPALFDEFHATISAVTNGKLLAELDRRLGEKLYLMQQKSHTLAVLYAATVAGIRGDFIVAYFDIKNRTTEQTLIRADEVAGKLRQFVPAALAPSR